MTGSNRTLLVEILGRRIHFAIEAGGCRFEHSGVVIAWQCPCAGFEDELGYALLVRDDETLQDDYFDFHEIKLISVT